jgi:hypothetical protein
VTLDEEARDLACALPLAAKRSASEEGRPPGHVDRHAARLPVVTRIAGSSRVSLVRGKGPSSP